MENHKVKDEPESENTIQTTTDMTAFVQNLLGQMQTRFQVMADGILSKIDDLGSRIDEMERSLNALKGEVSTETSVKPSYEEPKPEPKPDSNST